MKKNVGKVDRVLRITSGVVIGVILALGVVRGIYGVVLGLFGIMWLITGIIRFCPTYVPFGISTCSKDEKCAVKMEDKK